MPLKFPCQIRFLFTPSLPRTTNLSSFNSVSRAYHHNTSTSTPFLSRLFSSLLNHFAIKSHIKFSTRPNGGKTRSPRSLIEDEEELSNWVTDLSPGTLCVNLTSDDDEDSLAGRPSSVSRFGFTLSVLRLTGYSLSCETPNFSSHCGCLKSAVNCKWIVSMKIDSFKKIEKVREEFVSGFFLWHDVWVFSGN